MQQPPAGILKKLFPELIFDFKSENQNAVFLTFDDGPDPDVTPWVLDTLAEYGAKATFFVLGKNISLYTRYLTIFANAGMSIGNHSYSHPSGWKTETEEYVKDIRKASAFIPGALFRPPYGKITPAQIKILSAQFKILMWNRMTYDFSIRGKKFNPERIKPGDIVVFHDTKKAFPILREKLPATLNYLKEKNWEAKAITF